MTAFAILKMGRCLYKYMYVFSEFLKSTYIDLPLLFFILQFREMQDLVRFFIFTSNNWHVILFYN